MITFGNTEVKLEDIMSLHEIAGGVSPVDVASNEILISFNRTCYTQSQVKALLTIVHRMSPNECEEVNNRLRLWWD